MAGPTPTLNDVDILTPQELFNLVIALIIDNNINAITPAKARQVFISIIAAYAGRSSNISGIPPILWDAFTGQISIPRASASVSGYLHKDDFVAFAGSSPLDALEVRVFKKAAGNTGGYAKEPGDWVFGEPVAGTYWKWAIVGADPEDYNTYTVVDESSLP